MLENTRKLLTKEQLGKIVDGVHYDGTPVYLSKSEWVGVVGQRTNGKSFFWLAVITMEFFEFGYHFAYVRRQKEEMQIEMIEDYFADENYQKWLKNNYGYDAVKCKAKKLYFIALDENGDIIKEQTLHCGQAFSVSTQRNYKSLHFDKIANCLYEEFITDGLYVQNEWKKWNNLLSTIFRAKDFGRAILIGNTIERNCPYFREMGINILKLKQGTITQYENDGVSFTVEYTGVLQNIKTRMVVGQTARQINKGEWDTNNFPHLFCDLDETEKLFKFFYCYNEFCFKCECFIYNDRKYLFIRPYDKDKLFGNYYDDIFEKGFHLENNFYNIAKKKKYKKLWDLFIENKVVYSDNLCGTEFNNCLKYFNPFINARRL